MITKSGIKATLLALESHQLEVSQASYARFLKGAAVDPTEPSDDDQVSQAEANAEIAQAFDATFHSHAEAVRLIEATDFGATSEVRRGAALRLAGRWYVVAVSTQAFEHEGTMFMGISADAPLFLAAEGLRAGDRFEVNGRTWLIEEVA